MTERFIRWLEREMLKRDIGTNALARKTGIAASTISYWLSGKHEPDDANIDSLAVYFGMDRRSIYEFLGRIEPTQLVDLTEAEMDIIARYRSLSPVDRGRFLRLAEAFAPYQAEQEEQPADPAALKP